MINDDSCRKCKAYKNTSGSTPVCKLGYPIDKIAVTPLTDCPRPLIYLDLIELLKEKGVQNAE